MDEKFKIYVEEVKDNKYLYVIIIFIVVFLLWYYFGSRSSIDQEGLNITNRFDRINELQQDLTSRIERIEERSSSIEVGVNSAESELSKASHLSSDISKSFDICEDIIARTEQRINRIENILEKERAILNSSK